MNIADEIYGHPKIPVVRGDVVQLLAGIIMDAELDDGGLMDGSETVLALFIAIRHLSAANPEVDARMRASWADYLAEADA